VAWFSNKYVCPKCRSDWDSDWSCGCDDECPECGEGDISPVSSEDRTVVVKPESDDSWAFWRSTSEAEENPCYVMVGKLQFDKSGRLQFVVHLAGT
jgi:hypothetical protein